MKELNQIIKSLNSREVYYIKSYLQGSQRGNQANKKLQLFRLLRKEEDLTNKKAAQIIYDSAPDSKLSHLKSMLKSNILGLIFLQEGDQIFNKTLAQKQFDVLKQFLLGKLLLSRGQYEVGLHQLAEASEAAEEFELASEQLLIDDTRRTHKGSKEGIEAYDAFETRIHESLTLARAIIYAREYIHKVTLPTLYKGNKEPKQKKNIAHYVSQLKQLYDKTQSSRVGYWYHNISLYAQILEEAFEGALSSAHQILDLVENNEAIYSQTRKAEALLHIATNHLQLHQPQYARSPSKEAFEILKSNMLNEVTAARFLFYSLFYAGQYKQAYNLAYDMLAHPQVKDHKLLQAKWKYFLANLHYLHQQYDEANTLLFEHSELLKDSSGWSLGYKLLKLYIDFEKEDSYLLFEEIENLERFVYRYQFHPIARTQLICYLFKKLSHHQFHPFKLYQTQLDKIQLLKSNQSPYRWNPTEYELIPFHRWIQIKGEQQSLKKIPDLTCELSRSPRFSDQ